MDDNMEIRKRISFNKEFELYEVTTYNEYGNKTVSKEIKCKKLNKTLPIHFDADYGFMHLDRIWRVSKILNNTTFKIVKQEPLKSKPHYIITESGNTITVNNEILKFSNVDEALFYIHDIKEKSLVDTL
jgi:hypothetical protein